MISRKCAYIDLDCPEAAQVLIKAWNTRYMDLYPTNCLEVSIFDPNQRKLSRDERKQQQRSKTP
jgi:hypothetical protein